MRFTRRNFLAGGGLALASALLSGCGPLRQALHQPQPFGSWPTGDQATWRRLSRMSFGPTAAERAHVADIGLNAWIEQQLAPATLDDTEASRRLLPFDSLAMDASTIFDLPEETARRELQQAALLRAVYSRRQLHEVMVDFWSDHFNISTLKGDCAWLKIIDDREVVRPHALGKFADLLWASINSPAMLVYLDNQENHAGKPNENYARELLELHTLGVDGGYSQSDVQELARCLTGWSVGDDAYWGHVRFLPEQHDDGPKHVLGQFIPAGGGQRDVEQVFETMLAHPALPRFIARKLVRRFVADEPPAALVEAAAASFARSGGDISTTLRTVLLAPEMAAAPPKLKRPFHMVAGALRQLHADTDGGPPLLEALARMGQPLFQWHTPDGYPDVVSAWSSSLLPRWQFALNLATGGFAGTSLDLAELTEAAGVSDMTSWLDQAATLLYGGPLPSATRTQLTDMLGADWNDEQAQLALAVLLAAPAYQWR
ncbi:MAG: DUF1800 domain-containing protein [Chloroflexaceae bacterium]|jgi:uncharacterized protein (DUF1800 family)|nr:DUF1800 domain-containing protein [Chloroflexaceae bacterium]